MDSDKVKREVRGWVLTILAVLAFRTLLYEAVYIPSGSMIPTLQIGDYVIVEKWAYGARLPFTESTQLQWSAPKRGDVVVLLAPPGNPRSDDLIKRVVAVGGDRVEIRDGALWLNGQPAPRQRVPGPCAYWNKPEGGPWTEEPCVAFEEQLERHRYGSYCTPSAYCGDVPEVVVPPGTVWLAGDHRDHSADSRVFGPVPIGRIKGRAVMALASWGPSGPRWTRLFHRVDH
ncbi:signal peptidase I [Anaeromyxobacter paludicola]|uniref:Signal peptidase I n=1 Tax=Anaeromyxobacter paludicola TaxID=2918171 RepID=A0ABM7XDI9_9BACT|nr:signal peptidase I [Anaeromyxobacter paludicola]BDG09932.1 signal peptidase I [Anaeromyxobacter paludicola]